MRSVNHDGELKCDTFHRILPLNQSAVCKSEMRHDQKLGSTFLENVLMVRDQLLHKTECYQIKVSLQEVNTACEIK